METEKDKNSIEINRKSLKKIKSNTKLLSKLEDKKNGSLIVEYETTITVDNKEKTVKLTTLQADGEENAQKIIDRGLERQKDINHIFVRSDIIEDSSEVKVTFSQRKVNSHTFEKMDGIDDVMIGQDDNNEYCSLDYYSLDYYKEIFKESLKEILENNNQNTKPIKIYYNPHEVYGNIIEKNSFKKNSHNNDNKKYSEISYSTDIFHNYCGALKIAMADYIDTPDQFEVVIVSDKKITPLMIDRNVPSLDLLNERISGPNQFNLDDEDFEKLRNKEFNNVGNSTYSTFHLDDEDFEKLRNEEFNNIGNSTYSTYSTYSSVSKKKPILAFIATFIILESIVLGSAGGAGIFKNISNNSTKQAIIAGTTLSALIVALIVSAIIFYSRNKASPSSEINNSTPPPEVKKKEEINTKEI